MSWQLNRPPTASTNENMQVFTGLLNWGTETPATDLADITTYPYPGEAKLQLREPSNQVICDVPDAEIPVIFRDKITTDAESDPTGRPVSPTEAGDEEETDNNNGVFMLVLEFQKHQHICLF
ncbi:uncharacterized protein LDX57_009285 [Aspergillus melleus]|uniref:uncharacterized protein n=1 Tax=Aspergillus melleus TaxID=138277 RepID=UPI001E8D52C3|nr:uncharacterized protein LDX57_009285 [Aspergillus melleus]KAH8431628.1 hypothetical protein LDX57_009285 [Aspergillus melleus]